MYLTVINIKKRKVRCPINIKAGTLKRCLNYSGTHTAFNTNYRIVKEQK